MTAVVCCTGIFAWTQSNLACNECSRACSGPREPTREPSNTPSAPRAPTPRQRQAACGNGSDRSDGPTKYRRAATSAGFASAARARARSMTVSAPGKICSTANGARSAARLDELLERHRWPAPVALPPGSDDDVHLSHLLAEQGETERPPSGTGIARHPSARVTCENQSAPLETAPRDALDYLVLRNRCGDSGPKPRTLLFLLAAATKAAEAFPGPVRAVAADPPREYRAVAAAPLRRVRCEDRCLERRPTWRRAWGPTMRPSGDCAVGRASLAAPRRGSILIKFNEEQGDADAADGAQGRPASFIHMLEAVAAPDYFVAVKVDIDTPDVELTIVADASASAGVRRSSTSYFLNTTFSSTRTRRGCRIFARAPLRPPARRWRDNDAATSTPRSGSLHRPAPGSGRTAG